MSAVPAIKPQASSAYTFNASAVPVDYMAEPMKAYVEDGARLGSFSHALLTNDLHGAFVTADQNNLAAMQEWVTWCRWNLPAGCWGSVEKVKAWEAAGGMRGLLKAKEAAA